MFRLERATMLGIVFAYSKMHASSTRKNHAKIILQKACQGGGSVFLAGPPATACAPQNAISGKI